jgi:hypothetical protein
LAVGLTLASLAGGVISAKNLAQAVEAGQPVDQRAIEALSAMSRYLGTLQTFELKAETETDEVMEDGLKLRFGGTTTYKVRRKDGLFVQLISDRKVRQFYYNGKTLTVTAPRMGVYAQIDAPPTIGELLERMNADYGIGIPLADLFYWGTDEAMAASVLSAQSLGFALINGEDTDHYAFRGKDVDWQVWIRRGDTPTPAKIVLTSKNEPDAPTYSAELKWNAVAAFGDEIFVFTPPEGAVKISVADATQLAKDTQ